MQSINSYLNPFSNDFQQSFQHYHSLPLVKKAAAVAAAIFGALATPYLLCLGGFVAFQLAVKWLKSSRDAVQNADENTETLSRTSQTHNVKVDKLRKLFQLSHEERKNKAVEEGFTPLTDPSNYSGKGFLTYTKETYQGNFKNGRRNGKGLLYIHNPDGYIKRIYQGDFHHDKISGTGIEVGKEGYWFVGSFKDGMYDGTGIFRNVINSTTMTGSFIRGVPTRTVKIIGTQEND